jgi:hypothetical protein
MKKAIIFAALMAFLATPIFSANAAGGRGVTWGDPVPNGSFKPGTMVPTGVDQIDPFKKVVTPTATFGSGKKPTTTTSGWKKK